MMLSAGQMNDQKGADILAPLLPPARKLIVERGIAACIPPKKNRKQPIPYDKALYRQRHRIEIALPCGQGSSLETACTELDLLRHKIHLFQ